MVSHRLTVARDDCLGIIAGARTVALVGVSADERRASYFVIAYLAHTLLKIYPINPKYSEIAGIKCYPNLASLPLVPDIVVIFRKAEAIPPIVEEAIHIGSKAVWFQLGLHNEQAAARAQSQGLAVIQDRCIKLEHARWAGKLRWAGANTGVISSRRRKRLH